MNYATSPREITRAQRVAIALRKAVHLEAEVTDKTGRASKKPIGFGAVIPECEKCPEHNRPFLGCQRFGNSFVAEKPIRIDYYGKGSDNEEAAIRFCPRSYDDAYFASRVLEACNSIDRPEGIYPYFGKPTIKLWERQYAFIRDALGARDRLLRERDDTEGA